VSRRPDAAAASVCQPMTRPAGGTDIILSMDRLKLGVCGVLVFLAVLGAYANHFHNGFHFDDAHTIQENPYVRDLRFIPRFFVDATTFSTLPTHQSYRPLITATIAIDYHLSAGPNGALRLDDLSQPNTLWFHVDTFIWYIALLASMFFLFVRLMDMASPSTSPNNGYVAMFAVALYGLHPVSAESVNYVVQRGEVHSTLGVVLGLVVYIYWPSLRKWGLYLLPVIVGSLSKPPALMFLPIVFVYVYLYESDTARPEGAEPDSVASMIARGFHAIWASIPAAVVFVVMGVLQWMLTPKTYVNGGTSMYLYVLTQPIVILHYIKQFFLPTELSADTDRNMVNGILSETVVLSVAMLVMLIAFVWPKLRRAEMRPLTFGLWWFVFALAPTSLQNLSEVENDHRMFFPFVGFTLAIVWAVWRWVDEWRSHVSENREPYVTSALALFVVLVLAGCGWGTYQRNQVWHGEDSLWKDVTEKSPRNGRGLMNYGLTMLNRGDYNAALELFQRAEVYTPSYATLKLNLGIVQSALGNDTAAEARFHEALALTPDDAQCYYFYARFLKQHNRNAEAIGLLRQAISMNSTYAEPRYLLMQTYSDLGDAINLRALAEETLKIFPSDQSAALFLARGAQPTNGAVQAVASAPQGPPTTAEGFLTQSLNYELAGKHEECIAAAKEALKLRPGYPEAYNNIAAANQSLGRWDEAVKAATEAVRLRPDFQLAKNNLNYALEQKRLHGSGK
jgi:protein O-mannosyl-transferase